MNTIANESIQNNDGNSVFSLFKNSRFLQFCTAVLVVQLALAALLGMTQKQATFASGQALFSLQMDEISRITIDNAEDTVALKKTDGQWALEGEAELPVDKTRLNTLLSSLVDLKAGLPVASSIQARTQLEVADDQYQRRVIVNNDAKNNFLIGTSPGLRKAHLRREGANEIYSASLPVSDLPTSLDQWLDKSLLKFDDITRVSSTAITFERNGTDEDSTWRIVDHHNGAKTLDTKKLASAINALETLHVIGLKEASVVSSDGDASNDTETVELSITSAETILSLRMEKSSGDATITRSDIDQTFIVSEPVFKQLSVLASDAEWLVDDAEKAETTQ